MTQDMIVAEIPALRRYARALTGDTWLADDLVQDTLERACNKWRLWLAGSNLRAWLFSVMHNLFVNQLRQAAPRAKLTLVTQDEWPADEQASGVDVGLMLDLQRCLMRLPPEQREVLLLVSLEDMRYTDVARVTGVPLGTVMSRLSRARARLQELLEAPARVPTDQHDASSASSRVPALHRLK